MTLVFTVFGVPQQKGSIKAFVPKGWNRPILTDTNRNLKMWAQLVAEGASRSIQQLPAADRGCLTEGVRLTVAFYLPRPKALMRRGLEVAHLKKPDLDKLVRGVKDALTRVVWTDDSLVVELVATKQYADVDGSPHVDIRVEPTAGTRPIVVPVAPLPLFHELVSDLNAMVNAVNREMK